MRKFYIKSPDTKCKEIAHLSAKNIKIANMILQETYTLNNGVKIPKIALGTWMVDNDKVGQAVEEAIKIVQRYKP